MKLLYLRTDFYGAVTDGGSFTMQRGILNGLVELGVNVEIVTSCPAPDHGLIPVHHVPYGQLHTNLPEVLSIAHNTRVSRRIRAVLERFAPDVIYQRHSSHNITGAMIHRCYGVPYILQFDGSEVWMKTHWSKTYFRWMLREAERLALRCACLVTVVSAPMQQMACDSGAAPERVVVIPNGVDIQAFSPHVAPSTICKEYGWEDVTVVGFVGTFDRWHGADVLAEAISIAVQHEPSLRAIFIGDGMFHQRVRQIIHEKGIESAVAMIGRIPHAEVPLYIAACDIVVVPTLPNPDGSEFFGSPTKLFEYMAMGKAIIASPLGQVGTIIQDGENGLWCEPGNVHSLAEQIIRLARDRDLRHRLGVEARNDAVMHHSWTARARTLVNAWENWRSSKSKM